MAENFFRKLANAFVFLFWTIIFWVVFPLVYIIVSPLYVYRLFVKYLAKIIHPDWIGLMSVRDVFVSEEMNSKKGLTSVVSLVFVLKGIPNLDQIRQSFLTKVLLQKNKRGELHYTKFKYYSEYWMGFPWWKMSDFKLENHIRFLEETTNKKETTEEEFVEIMGPLSTKNFSPKMAPWEMLIVDNYKPASSSMLNVSENDHKNDTNIGNENNNNSMDSGDKDEPKFALIFRFHHTLLDGFSVVKLVVENFGGLEKEFVPKAPRDPPSTWQMFCYFFDTLIHVGIYHWKILLLDLDVNVWHVPLKKLTGQWHTVMTSQVPFDLARQASKKIGVATTTILFGSIAGGIRRYWRSYEKSEIPKLMHGLFPLPIRNHPLDGMINHWTFANIPLPLKTPDPLARLQEMSHNFNKLKTSSLPGLVWLFSPLYMGVPSWLVNLWGTNRMTTVTLSNFPGPRKKIVFFDKWPIEDTMYWLPRLRGNASMNMAILTYKGTIRITLTVDKAVMPRREDAQKLANCIQEELFSFQNLPLLQQQIQMA